MILLNKNDNFHKNKAQEIGRTNENRELHLKH